MRPIFLLGDHPRWERARELAPTHRWRPIPSLEARAPGDLVLTHLPIPKLPAGVLCAVIMSEHEAQRVELSAQCVWLCDELGDEQLWEELELALGALLP